MLYESMPVRSFGPCDFGKGPKRPENDEKASKMIKNDSEMTKNGQFSRGGKPMENHFVRPRPRPRKLSLGSLGLCVRRSGFGCFTSTYRKMQAIERWGWVQHTSVSRGGVFERRDRLMRRGFSGGV